MNGNFERCLALVLKSEGGYVDNPKDPGGMTNLGVTKDTWEAYVGRTVDEAEMRGLTPDDVAPLYKRNYWDRDKCDQLPAGIDYIVFDCGVNSGTSEPIKLIQRALNLPVDGVIGPNTLAAIQQRDLEELLEQFSEEHLQYLQSLKVWSTFANGFQRRIKEVLAAAQAMVHSS